jgi:hypothetical protein
VSQFIHNQLTDKTRRNLAFSQGAQFVSDMSQRGINGVIANGSLFERSPHACPQFGLRERLPSLITFHHLWHDELGALKGGEAFAAL